MALSTRAKKRFEAAMARRTEATEMTTMMDTVEAGLAADVLYAAVALTDPGTGAAIPVTRSASIAITTAAAETNTLAIPTFLGQRLSLCLDVRAVGDRVITSAARINTAGNTVITMNTAGDAIILEAIRIAGVLRWQVVVNDGCTLS